ncbi:CBF1-interacting co-repressor CIR, N-terminal domain [Phaffia rhodozyma]|uniref:CBF1-interacting co-repressor CIR, N-terminal domain n=1 Tax=Phaffia rhodozyma TaxID=264483 RepID=A0A0F7SMD6_PHARH|nr:CBF1-interacting co-repressor CIR, N-terminal domain [Phaffia rhodozyma]
MPRLQILVHKSYHPYLEKNKQRVRDDERKEEERIRREEERVLLADSEARLALLRDRNQEAHGSNPPLAESSSSSSSRPRKEIDYPSVPASDPFYAPEPSSSSVSKGKGKARARDDMRDLDRQLSGTVSTRIDKEGGRTREHGRRKDETWEETYRDQRGHLNFWASEERAGPPRQAETPRKKTADEVQAEDPYTMYLSRPISELEPWYVHPEMKRPEQRGEAKDEKEKYRRDRDRKKEERSKTSRDPLTLMNTLLSSSSHPPVKPKTPSGTNTVSTTHSNQTSRPPHSSVSSATEKRLQRETAERARALALVEASKRKRERELMRMNGGGSVSGGSTPALSLQGTESDWGTPRERAYEEQRFFPEAALGGSSRAGIRENGRKW